VQQIRGFSLMPATVVRGGISVPITDVLTVRAYTERNPLFATGGSPWVHALRIEQTVRMPMLRAPGTTGYVYRDLNGNRMHDEGEPGLDAAILRRGADVAATDATGKYRLVGTSRLPIVLDESSLPVGSIHEATTSPNIAVSATASAEIRFIVSTHTGEESIADLSAIRVSVRDTAAKEWVGRMTAPMMATFDALPLGTYTITLDLSGLAEPLILRPPTPSLYVIPFLASFVSVYLDPRPLKIWRADASARPE
jgi:hypothetical protein